MRRRRIGLAALFAIAVSIGGSVHAQEWDDALTGSIVVARGQATARRQADIYLVTGEIRATASTRVEALAALDSLQDTVVGGLNAMDIEAIEVRTGSLGVGPTYPGLCDDNGRPRTSTATCEITGYSAELQIIARVRPARRAGDVLSLMSELGASTTSLGDARLSDRDSLTREAAQQAIQAAEAEATAMATVAGGRLGRILRIQNARADYGRRRTDEIVVTGSRVTREGMIASAPTVALEVAPPDIEETADITVVFELLP